MKKIRAVVSGSRNRYTRDGYDLDLTYITPNLIAMGYPASGVEKTYRNDINQVSAFFNTRHRNAYRVYNLSERRYDYAKFNHNVQEFGFPDHHPPPLQLLIDIMNDMLEWTSKDPDNVLIVHCLAGKGRTGVICSSYLLLTGEHGNLQTLQTRMEMCTMASATVRHFSQLRGQGVQYPSQALYIYYFIKLLRKLKRVPLRIPRLLPPKRVFLRQIVLYGIPDFEAPPRGGCTPFLQVLPAPWQYHSTELLYNSSWQRPVFETFVADENGSIVFDTNCYIEGDILIRCFHANAFTMLGKHIVQMFHFTFHTSFLPKNSIYRLQKVDIDEAAENFRFPEHFYIECHYDTDEEIASARDACVVLRETNQRSQSLIVQNVDPRASLFPLQPCMGWLYKQGGFVKSWKQRWFVARDGKLTYYEDKSVPTPLGIVDLKNAHVDICQLYELRTQNSELYYFKIVPLWKDQRTYYLAAETEEDLTRWIRVISRESCHSLLKKSILSATQQHRQTPLLSAPYRFSDTILECETHFRSSKNFQRPNSIESSASTQLLTPMRHHSSITAPVKSTVTGRSLRTSEKGMARCMPSKPLYESDLKGRNTNDLERVVARDLEQSSMTDYLYTADELQEADRLQKYLQKEAFIMQEITACMTEQGWDQAERLLIDIVQTDFPLLLDAVEFHPIQFLQMILTQRDSEIQEVEF